MNYDLPCGVLNTTYEKDIAIVRTKARWAWLCAGIFLSIVLPPLLGAHWLSWCIETCVVIVAVLGLYFVTGLCGQISLGQAGFMAVGAYSATFMMTHLGMSFWLVVPLASVITGIVAVIFGLPSLRVKGFYLAMATLASQHIIIWLITHPPFNRWSGGFDGMTVPAPQLGGFVFDTNQSLFYVTIITTWIMIFFAKNIGRTHVGRCFVSVRDSDLAASVLGINIFRYKLTAFYLAGIFAGVAGALYAPYIMRISPDSFNMENSIWYLGMLVVGGSGSIVGAISGVIFIRLLLELTVIFGPSIQHVPFIGAYISNYLGGIVFGLVIILFLIFEPRGINHRWTIFKASFRHHPFSY